MTNQEAQPAKRTARKTTAAPVDPPAADSTVGEQSAAGPAPVPVHVAWARVMADVQSLAKTDRNTDQGFVFRGIDATMNACGPALRAHGVSILPVAVEILADERYETKRGALMHGLVTRHDWLIVGPAGDTMRMQTLGQAADSGDKVATKAASVAYRTALLQSLTIPTGDRDPDADSHERGTAAEPDPRQEQWDRIMHLAEYARQSPAAVAAHYAEKMGHKIDGPDATVATLTEYADRLEAHLRKEAAKEAEAHLRKEAAKEAQGAQEPQAGGAAAEEPQTVSQAVKAEREAREAEPPPVTIEDVKQRIFGEILELGKQAGMSPLQIKSDYRRWARAAEDVPEDAKEIDGPGQHPDWLTRFKAHLRRRLDGQS